jgi:hypothetical protein
LTIALLVMTDGRREYLQQTLGRFDEMAAGTITRRVIHDDSGDADYARWLRRSLPGYEIVVTGGRTGFAAAMASAWRTVADGPEPFVMHLEDDFLFTRPVNLDDLTGLLADRPYLAQVAFRRQAWGAEIEHGGFMAMMPGAYSEHTDGRRYWVETIRNYSTNPSVHRRELCHTGWPQSQHSEGLYGFQLRETGLPWGVAPDDVRFGFWGSMADGGEWIWHIGDYRRGHTY